MEKQKTVSIEDIVDESPLSRFQILVLALCASIVAIDGFDTAAIGYIAPALRQEWKLPVTALAPAFSAGLFGLMVGALALGSLADRLGRKRVMLLSVLVFGAGTAASAASTSLEMLIVLRFLTGLGLGAAMPTSIALTSEYSPKRHRMFLVTLSFCGFTAGFALGGELAARLIDSFGWRSVLLTGGVVPLVLLPVLALWLPESVRFLAMRPLRSEELKKLVRRICGDDRWDQFRIVAAETSASDSAPRIRQLLGRGWRMTTVSLWLAYFCSLFVFYLLSSWLPTIMREQGYAISTAARIAAMAPLGGTIGALVLARLMDRLNPFYVLGAAYLLSSGALVLIGYTLTTPTSLAAAVFCAGFGVVGGQTGMNALTANLYPTNVRATGLSCALAMGRLGSIVGAVSGGVLLSVLSDGAVLFQFIAIPPLLGAIALGGLSRRRRDAVSAAQMSVGGH
nr:aromatic acid/H+ symport family MFS transporter [uncultured Cupriavidus sp.]